MFPLAAFHPVPAGALVLVRHCLVMVAFNLLFSWISLSDLRAVEASSLREHWRGSQRIDDVTCSLFYLYLRPPPITCPYGQTAHNGSGGSISCKVQRRQRLGHGDETQIYNDHVERSRDEQD